MFSLGEEWKFSLQGGWLKQVSVILPIHSSNLLISHGGKKLLQSYYDVNCDCIVFILHVDFGFYITLKKL